MTTQPETRAERRAAILSERRADRHRASHHSASTFDRIRPYLFAAITVGVLTVGAILAFGDFFDRPAAASGTIDVQSSMAGFTPSEIHVKAGATVTMNWWTDDAAMHLENGVHTMIAPDLDLYEELPAEGTRMFVWQVPNKPGTYDVYCNSCCGGVDNPQMHGKIVIEAA